MDAKLNVKQWLIAWLAVFVIMTVIAFVVMKLELAPWFVQRAEGMPEGDATRSIFIYLGRLINAGLFTYIFTKTLEGGKTGIGHGLRYGFGISLLMLLPWLFSSLALSEFPASALYTRTIVGIVEALINGAVVAYIYKPVKPATA